MFDKLSFPSMVTRSTVVQSTAVIPCMLIELKSITFFVPIKKFALFFVIIRKTFPNTLKTRNCGKTFTLKTTTASGTNKLNSSKFNLHYIKCTKSIFNQSYCLVLVL